MNLYLEALSAASPLSISAATLLDLTLGAGTLNVSDAALALLNLFGAETAAFDAAQAAIARDAQQRFGSGRHRLNFGDTFAYALAKHTGEPLLFKGDDFARTDILSAL